MKVLIATIKYFALVFFVGIVAVTIAAYLDLPVPTKPLVVQTGSMNPAIPAGSLVVISERPTDGAGVNYVENDVVTFKKGNTLVSHRVVRVVRENREKFFQTKGDANAAADPELVSESAVVGKVVFAAPFVGKLVAFVKQPAGFLLLVAVPTLFIIISELFVIFEEIRKKPKKKSMVANIYKPITLTAVALVFVGTSFSYFSDVAVSENNVFQTSQSFCSPGEVFQIGDSEGSQLDNPADELNFVAFGNFPTFPDPFAVGTNADSEFPWNSNKSQNYATDFDVTFVMPYSSTAKLTISWAPGRSGSERKEVLLDGVSIGTTPTRNGSSVAGWWENMQRFEDSFTASISEGPHTFTFLHPIGDGTVWDFVKLEILECNNLSLKINEFVANPGTQFNTEWVEIYNDGNVPVDLTGWYLQDNTSTTKSLSALGTISPGAFVFLDIAEGFLNNSSPGDSVFLKNPLNNVVDSTSYSTIQADDISRGRDTDGSGLFKICTTATKGTSNNGVC